MKSKHSASGKVYNRNITVTIIFSLLIFFIIAGIMELVLRTTHLFGARVSWSEPDPVLGYRNKPHSIYWYMKENDHFIKEKINNFGWIDKDWALKKPSGIYRVALLGDSFVEAMQVELDSNFLALAERELNDNRNMKIELMNFGRSGFTQTEELIVLKNEVMQFTPDMVILFFFPGNDIDDIDKTTAASALRPFYLLSDSGQLILDTSFINTPEYKIKRSINWFKQRSALVSLISERYNLYRLQVQIRKRKSQENKNSINGYLSLATTNPHPVYSSNYKLNKILIEEMANLCKERGAKFMLVTIDNPAYIPAIEKKYIAMNSTFSANYFEDDLENYARFLNIEYLGLQRIFREYYEENSIPLHWEHWNYEGHKVVAKVLTNKLKSIITKE